MTSKIVNKNCQNLIVKKSFFYKLWFIEYDYEELRIQTKTNILMIIVSLVKFKKNIN